MKITNTILSIPPYVSASWSHIASLYMKGSLLVITLQDNSIIEIPELDKDTITNIFDMHISHLERTQKQNLPLDTFSSLFSPHAGQGIAVPVHFGLDSPEALGASIFEHNPSQADIPEIPKEILHKIAAIAKIVSPSEVSLLPKPEQHCNCVHCQLARVVQEGPQEEWPIEAVEMQEEIVTEKDLTFRSWDISHINKEFYRVSNPFDPEERYHVFLGNPVGCTCGRTGCEHVIAVLKS